MLSILYNNNYTCASSMYNCRNTKAIWKQSTSKMSQMASHCKLFIRQFTRYSGNLIDKFHIKSTNIISAWKCAFLNIRHFQLSFELLESTVSK